MRPNHRVVVAGYGAEFAGSTQAAAYGEAVPRDEIMTTGGLFGRITHLEQDSFDLEIAPGTVVHFARGAVGRRIGSPSEPDPTSADETSD